MREIGKILAYLIATIILGALLAPPLYWAGQWVGHQFGIPFLVETPFQRYFNRAILVAVVVLLWPLVRLLDVTRLRDATMQRDPWRWRNLAFGLAVSIGLMTILGFLLVYFDVYKLRSSFRVSMLVQVFTSAAGASVIEELLFRGAILSLALRCGSRWGALCFTSALYSIVHFLKSPEDAVPHGSVTFGSGFALVPDAFWQFEDPLLVIGGFSTLFVLGMILGYAALRTRSLWLPIGLHAGMIVGKFGFTKIARRRGEPDLWFGKSLEIGLGAVCLLALLAVILWWWLSYVDSRRPESRQ